MSDDNDAIDSFASKFALLSGQCWHASLHPQDLVATARLAVATKIIRIHWIIQGCSLALPSGLWSRL